MRIIVPLPAGGTTDILARMVAQQLNAAWAQPVVIDNRGGANGNIGTEAAVKSPPDGYTLLVGSMSTHTMNQFLYAKLGYDPVNDVAGSIGVVHNAGERLPHLRHIGWAFVQKPQCSSRVVACRRNGLLDSRQRKRMPTARAVEKGQQGT